MKLKLKNYRVIKKIGHGGMGLVYVAEDLALGRLVALKVLAPYLVQDPEILERFRSEARNQAQLVHANITMVYSFLVEDEQAFLVLEFIDGETLESRINREGRIVTMEALPIFRKILDALGYAHSKGVIHRDIKPGNIAFTSEGNVKIMDFGIALNIEETGRLTKTGHVLGTPHYMAPEQILGKELTFRTDIYALGITLFEMVSGRLPFDSKSDYEVRVAQINYPPPSLRSFGYQDITPELEEVIFKALAKEPEARFASAREFLQALEAAVGRDHLVTLVKGVHLDKSTQVLEANQEPLPLPSEPEIEEAAAPPAEAQPAEALAPPPPAPEREATPAPPPAEVQEISEAPPAPEEHPTPPAFAAAPETPPAPPPEGPIEELAPPSPPLEELAAASIPALAEPEPEWPAVPPLLEPEAEAPPISEPPAASLASRKRKAAAKVPPVEVQEISEAPPPPEEHPTPPAFAAAPEAPPAPPPEGPIEELAPPSPPPEELPAASIPALVEPEPEGPAVPPPLEPEAEAPQPPAPPISEPPAASLASRKRKAAAKVPPVEVQEISEAPPPPEEHPTPPAFAAAPETPLAPPPEGPIEELAPPSPPPEELPAASIPALAEPEPEGPAVPPPPEPEAEAPQPPAPPFPERPSRQEPATQAVQEEAPMAAAVQARGFSRPRLIFLPLALLSVLALVFFFRVFSPFGPSRTSQGLPPPQPGATPQKSVASPGHQPEKKPPVALSPPVAPPLSSVPKESLPAKEPEVAKEQPDKEKPLPLAALLPPEKKAETPKAKGPQPDELRKAIKDSLGAQGFSDVEVQVDAGKGVVISGNVKNAGQKTKITQIIDAMGLAVPTDYSRLKVVKEAVAKTVKRKRPEAASTTHETPEAAPKPALPEAPRKPLPPRIDRGNIQF